MASISAASVLCRIRDTTMQDLGKFLQETGKKIDWILLKHQNSTVKALNCEILDGVRTSLSIGMPSGPGRNNNNSSSSAQTFFAQTVTSDNGEDGTSAFEEEDFVRAFAEEIQKTVSNWSSKHRFMLQSKSTSAAGARREAMPSSGLGANSEIWRGGSHGLELETQNLNKPGPTVETQASSKLEFLISGPETRNVEFEQPKTTCSKKTTASSAQRDANAKDRTNAQAVSAVHVAAAVSRDDSARNFANGDDVSSKTNSAGAWPVAAAVSRDDRTRNLTNDDDVNSKANSAGAWHVSTAASRDENARKLANDDNVSSKSNSAGSWQVTPAAPRDENARNLTTDDNVSLKSNSAGVWQVGAAVSRDENARNSTDDVNVGSKAKTAEARHGASHPATGKELKPEDYPSLSSQTMNTETNEHQKDKTIVGVEETYKNEDNVSQPELNSASPKSPPNEELVSQLSDSDDGELHSEDMSHEPDSSMKSDTPQPSIAKKLQNSIKNRTAQQKCNQGGEVSSDLVAVKESNAAPDMFVTPIKSDNKSDSKLALTTCKDLWLPSGTVTKTRVSLTADVKPQIRQRAVQIITSPDWLPAGWVTELKTRNSGNSAGSKDKYYVDPVSKRRFRSRKEVFSYLETGKVNRYRKKSDTSPIRKLLGDEIEIPCSPPKPMIKKAKTKLNMAPSTSGHHTPIITSTQQSSGVGNMYMPFRSSQSSDWLVYDGMSSLPFPMFSPFQYGDYNSNKSTNSKPQPPAMRQWFFPGPETSWRPYWEQNSMGKPSDKSRGYHDMYSTMTPPPPPPPTFYPELASRPGSGRKLTKKTATGAM